MRRPLLPRPLRQRRAAAAAAVVALLSGLAGCKGGDAAEAASASPAAAALRASAPAMSTAQVPPPPAILAVATSPASSASGAAAGELASVHAQLEATLANASACSADSQCRTVATGAKACGGPTAYRAYSASKADPKAVADLAQREHELGMAEARASGEVSPCFMLADPGAHCQKSKCVTGPAGTN
jgi:hypothetical protein